jgi:hypothetical protein
MRPISADCWPTDNVRHQAFAQGLGYTAKWQGPLREKGGMFMLQ